MCVLSSSLLKQKMIRIRVTDTGHSVIINRHIDVTCPCATDGGKKGQISNIKMQNNKKHTCTWTMATQTANPDVTHGSDGAQNTHSYRAGLQNQLWQRHNWVWGERGFGGLGSRSQISAVPISAGSWGDKFSPFTLSCVERTDHPPS